MFWDVFYRLCKENNTKPNTVAKIIGVSTATCTKWKNGTIPNGETLLKLADYLDVSIDYLLGRTDKTNGYNNISNIDTTVNGTQANIINNNRNNDNFDDIKNILNHLSKANKLRAIADILDLLEEKYIKSEIEAEPKINVTYSKIYADEGGVTKKETPADLPKISEFFDD